MQGTASVVLSGVVAALNLVGGTLTDQTFLFLGAGEVNLLFLFVSGVSILIMIVTLFYGEKQYSPLKRKSLNFFYLLALYYFYAVPNLPFLFNFIVDNLQAGTGIAELIALELSKQVYKLLVKSCQISFIVSFLLKLQLL